MIRKLIGFTEKTNEMVEEIMDEKGYATFNATVQQAVIDMHDGIFKIPAYARAKPRIERTPVERAQSKAEDKKAQDIVREMELIKICEDLKGDIKDEAGGGKICTYYTYANKDRHKQTVSIGRLEDSLIDGQYYPSRKKVERLQAEGKTNY